MPRNRRPFVAIVTVDRAGRIESRLQSQVGDRMPVFRITDFRAVCVAARVIQVNARHARIGFSLFVPGVPEAENDDDALEALIAWGNRVATQLERRLPASTFRYLGRAA